MSTRLRTDKTSIGLRVRAKKWLVSADPPLTGGRKAISTHRMIAHAADVPLGSLTYHKNWFGKDLVAEVREGYANLKLTGVIDTSTDPEEIANRVTLDIFA